MSFLSDLFEGNFGNLGTDLVDAPSSLINHPDELAATLGGAALFAAPFVLPEIGAAALGGADVAAAAGGGDLAAGLGIGDIPAAAAADAAAGGDLAASLGIGDIAGAAAADTAGVDILGTVPADALAFVPEVGADLGGGALAFSPDITAGLADAGLADASFGDISSLSGADLSAGTDALALPEPDVSLPPADVPAAPAAPAAATPAATPAPAGFAPTDAELTGGITGTGNVGGGGGGFNFGSLTKDVGSVLSSPWTRLAAGAAPLALSLFRGEPALPPGAVQAQQNAAALASFGQQQLTMGQNGQLNAGQMALIAQTRQDLVNAARQALYNQGVQNPEADTRWPQMLAQIDQTVNAQTATMIQQEIQNGLNALGQSSQTLTQIAQLQMQADQNFTNTLVNATKALGLAVGGGGITRTTTTTTQAAA